MRTCAAAAVVGLTSTFVLLAQDPPHNGPRPVDPGWFALTGATVVVEPGVEKKNATVVFRDGIIVTIGEPAPAGATRIDCADLRIYPGLIEPFAPVDAPAVDPSAHDAPWNPNVQLQRHALDGAGLSEEDRCALRGLGFTTAAITPTSGTFAGTGSVVLLDDPSATAPVRVVREHSYLTANLTPGRSGYPNSEMGAIALVRQTLAGGRWYERCLAAIVKDPAGTRAPEPSAALQTLVDHRALPLWFNTRNELQALRALRLATEFERPAVVVGSGMEFRRLPALAATGAPIVVPLAYPEAPQATSAAEAERVSLRQLQTWEQAPTNTKRLLDAGLRIAWTTARLEDRSDFRTNLHQAMACGIDSTAALAALTTVPAELLGIDDRTGTIASGKLANFVVVRGDLFAKGAEIRDVWVGGRRHAIVAQPDTGLDGTWMLATWPGAAGGTVPQLKIDGKKARLSIGDDKVEVTVGARGPATISLRAKGLFGDVATVSWLRLHREDEGLMGVCTKADGQTFPFRGMPVTEETGGAVLPGVDEAATAEFEPPAIGAIPTPLGGYGFVELPEQESVAIIGATLWPCDGRDVIRNGTVLIRKGKIAYAGPTDGMPPIPSGTTTIEADGKHVTPGLIDCHSHTGISGGVNETGQAITAEARIQDVIDPDDANWYRQLAGGVTAVNQLHGSANVIGGQSSTVKIRYGVQHPDEMRLQGAPPGMKWALGENPRRANRSERSTRYPGTRMGVEAMIRDRLVAAEAYRREHAAYERLSPRARAATLPPRRDLELEALVEILTGARRIHCHSYRQDEIFMLCGIAGEYGIRIGTFQHVLEGYKVADAIAAHAVGGSSFSDWWGYKFEVYDAIPENGAIMHEVGVVVSFNSDSNEHARRLNTEAGKAVKYGGVAPAEALCFVTRNPAIQLGIFERTGSLTAGKDADVALWSSAPLSYASRCEATWVDGRRLFSAERDLALRAEIAAERARLLQKAARAAKRQDRPQRPDKDAYWRAEYHDESYCCRDQRGGHR